MSMTRALVCCVLALLAAGGEAQNSTTGSPLSAPSQLNRRIEVVLRSQFSVPSDVDVNIGSTVKSDIPGYQNMPITFAKDGKATTVAFLLSNDGNTIARLEKYDISHNPAEAISTQNRPVRGLESAKVTIVNFDDLQCPYCAQMHAMFFPETAARYKGLVRFVYKDYPLVESHPWAMHAAVDSTCLASQSGDAYWNFVDYVHSHAQEIGGGSHSLPAAFNTLDTLAHAEGLHSKLDLARLDSCTAKQDQSEVQASMKQGEGLGVNSTPTLFINGERVVGLEPGPVLWRVIDRALREAGAQPPSEATQPANRTGTTRSVAQQP